MNKTSNECASSYCIVRDSSTSNIYQSYLLQHYVPVCGCIKLLQIRDGNLYLQNIYQQSGSGRLVSIKIDIDVIKENITGESGCYNCVLIQNVVFTEITGEVKTLRLDLELIQYIFLS